MDTPPRLWSFLDEVTVTRTRAEGDRGSAPPPWSAPSVSAPDASDRVREDVIRAALARIRARIEARRMVLSLRVPPRAGRSSPVPLDDLDRPPGDTNP